jgi:hypothetical protein
MDRSSLSIPKTLAALLGLSLLSGPAAAWHWEDEQPHEFQWGQAGDPLVRQDAEGCLEAALHLHGLSCTVLYGHPASSIHLQPMDLIRPTDCSPGNPVIASPPISFHERNRVLFNVALHPWWERWGDCGDEILAGSESPNLILHPEFPIQGTWYLSVDRLAYIEGDHGLPRTGALPCVTVRMSLEDNHYRRGPPLILAQGETTKTVITATGMDDMEVDDPCPGSSGTLQPQQISRFDVDLGAPQRTDLGYTRLQWNISWHLWDTTDPAGIGPVMPDGWNIHSDQDHPPHLLLGIKQPFWHLEPKILTDEEGVRFNTIFGSPWGMYDLDYTNIRFTVTDNNGEALGLEHLQGPNRHNAHYWDHVQLNEMGFLWDIWEEALEDGTYRIEWSMTNFQHTADAGWNATLVIDGGTMTLYPGEPETEARDLSSRPGTTNALPAPGGLLVGLVLLTICLVCRPKP